MLFLSEIFLTMTIPSLPINVHANFTIFKGKMGRLHPPAFFAKVKFAYKLKMKSLESREATHKGFKTFIIYNKIAIYKQK